MKTRKSSIESSIEASSGKVKPVEETVEMVERDGRTLTGRRIKRS